MNWNAIIAIVEVAGLVAIVISLIYLAVQVRQNSELLRQNTLVARSSMVHETSVFYARFFELVAESGELANIYRRGINSEELIPDEVERFDALMEVYFSSLEDMDHQYKSDLYFDEEDEVDLVEYMAPSFRAMLESPCGSRWWEKKSALSSTPSFRDKIEKIRANWKAG